MIIRLYRTSSGRCPVEDFISELPKRDQADIFAVIEDIRGHGLNAPLVSMRQIIGKMSVRSDHQRKIGREIEKFPTIDQIIKEKEEKDSEFESEMNRARLRVAIARAIKIAREKAGLTQIELADALGIKQSQIARLESLKDKRLPSIDLLVKITNVTHRKIVVDQPLYRIELVAK